VVYLTDSDQRITGTRGKTRDVTRKAGDVVFEDTGVQHETLSKRAEFVSIELKQKPAGTVPVALDPVKLDPQHHIVLLENDRVRVLRTILEPQVKAPMHEHPHYVVVYLTELHTSMHMSDGRLIDNVRRAGEIGWRDALKHETENLGDRTAVEIQVELK
jgi:quercetin dioxygenase-like cupin family protein